MEKLTIGFASRLLSQAVEAGLQVWPEGDHLCVQGPEAAEPLALRLLENKSVLLPLLAEKRLKVVVCPGDECNERLVVIDGEGWCPGHKVWVQFVERVQ